MGGCFPFPFSMFLSKGGSGPGAGGAGGAGAGAGGAGAGAGGTRPPPYVFLFTTRVHINHARSSLFSTHKIGFGVAGPFCTFWDFCLTLKSVDVYKHRTCVR